MLATTKAKAPNCPACGSPRVAREIPEECDLAAHHTGDGWALFVEKDGEPVAMLKWPEAWPEPLYAADLRELGFRIV